MGSLLWRAGRFFRTTEGKIFAAKLFVAVLAVTILTKGAAAGVFFAAGVGFGLAIGGIVAGMRARDNGSDFADGFVDFIRNDWAASVAVSSVLFAASMGLGAGVSGIAGAVANKKAKLANAIALSEQLAMARAKTLQGLSNSKRPTSTSVAVNVKTGQPFFGDSKGSIGSIHPTLEKQMPSVSKTSWSVSNCAEFVATNNALHAKVKMKNLVVTTVKVKTLTPFPMCPNCKITLKNTLFVVSG